MTMSGSPIRGSQTRSMTLKYEFAIIGLAGVALLALIAFDVQGLPAVLPLVRLFLGLAFVLFVPGYALQAALFPRAADLDGPERLALSFGLSVAVVPPLALVLDWLPWGIRLWPIVAGEGLVVAALSIAALLRRRRLPAEERPVLAVEVDVGGWWAAQDRAGRILYGVLAGALLLAAGSAAAIILLPKPGEHFTEFYVLGPEGLARSVVVIATSDQPPVVRKQAAFTATRIAEHFRDGGQDVVRLALEIDGAGAIENDVSIAQIVEAGDVQLGREATRTRCRPARPALGCVHVDTEWRREGLSASEDEHVQLARVMR